MYRADHDLPDKASSELALEASLHLIAPLVLLLLREGVDYPRFADALKTVFLEAAEQSLLADDARVNDSSISTHSGIHRKDVRLWRQAGQPKAPAHGASAVIELYTRWATDPEYCDNRGKPKTLPRSGDGVSFETLARSVSKDVHPRALLQELMRLGVVRAEIQEGGHEMVAVAADAFVPKDGRAEMLQLFADNAADHLAAAVNNLAGGEPMLEQSVFADGLRTQSAEQLGRLARKMWTKVFREVAREATRLCDADRDHPDADLRVRLGMYYYHGPDQDGPKRVRRIQSE